jgi:hypothetical protein
MELNASRAFGPYPVKKNENPYRSPPLLVAPVAEKDVPWYFWTLA